MFNNSSPNTVLGLFGRSVRSEPWFYIYKHRLFVSKDDVDPGEVRQWLAARYSQTKRGHRYRIATYVNRKHRECVDAIYLETLTERDQVEIAMRWAITDQPVYRSGKRRGYRPVHLRPEEREQLDAALQEVKERFYEEVARKRNGQ